MKATKIHNTIILSLCLCILGYFANWAQNDYGMLVVLYALASIGICLVLLAYIQIQHKRIFRECLLIASSILVLFFVLPEINLPDFAIFILLVLGIFSPALFIPISIRISERNQPIKTNLTTYYTAIFLALFCIGNVFKMNHNIGAGIIITSSAFLLIPLLFLVVKLTRTSIHERSIVGYADIFMYIFISTNLIAFDFMRMHWPGAKIIAAISYSFIALLGLTLIWIKLRGEFVSRWWYAKTWLMRVTLITFLVTSLYYVLAKNNIAPHIYSNEFPPALQDLWANGNSLTTTGKENEKKADAYFEHYSNFLENRRDHNEKSNAE